MPLYSATSQISNPAAGQYIFTTGQNAVTTGATQGIGTLRLCPWVVTRPAVIDRIGGEITSAGDAGSKLRLGIYADNGNRYPGALLLDAGTINGDSATVQEITVSLALSPGLYWIGAAVQIVTTTQPTLRLTASATWVPPVPLPLGTSPPAAGATTIGYQQTSVTGALPGTFSATVTTSGSSPRVHVRAA